MGERFLDLPAEERREILEDRAVRTGRTPAVIEKDVWVCWTLAQLFTAPGGLPLVFKGGTSLSKVHGAIARFSEDIDITLDCRRLVDPIDPFDPRNSRARVKRHVRQLKAAMSRHVEGVILPWLSRAGLGPAASPVIAYDGSEKLHVRYESALPPETGYVHRSVLVEFGGRSSLDPNDRHVVTPYLADVVPELEFPAATVKVLRPERTFWEKAILMHAECCGRRVNGTKERVARHWYDLARLADHDIGAAALAARQLFADVIKYSRAYYPNRSTNYEECLSGGLRLVPGPEMRGALRADYLAMVQGGLLEGEAPSFDDILARLAILEATINSGGEETEHRVCHES